MYTEKTLQILIHFNSICIIKFHIVQFFLSRIYGIELLILKSIDMHKQRLCLLSFTLEHDLLVFA